MAHSKFPLFTFLALLGAAVSGCATTKNLSSDSAANEEITRSTVRDGAEIKLKDHTVEYAAFHVAVRADSTEWYSEDWVLRHAIATTSIESIRIRTPESFLAGVGSGFEAGIIPSMIVGLLAYSAGGSGLGIMGGGWNEAHALPGLEYGFGIVMAPFLIVGGLTCSDHQTVYESNPVQNQTAEPDLQAEASGKWVLKNTLWVFVPNDTLTKHDTTQTKLPN